MTAREIRPCFNCGKADHCDVLRLVAAVDADALPPWSAFERYVAAELPVEVACVYADHLNVVCYGFVDRVEPRVAPVRESVASSDLVMSIGPREVLRVTPTEFFVHGRRVPVDDVAAHDREVYRALRDVLRGLAGRRGPVL